MEPYATVKSNVLTILSILNQVMEEGVEFLEATGVLSQVRELGITTTHWEEAVLAFRFWVLSFIEKTVNSPLRQVAEQFDSYAMEIADKRPELLRLINDQVVK